MSISKLEEAIEQSFSKTVYDEINNVIGGDEENKEQKLTLLLPGIALAKEDFEYDYEAHEEKGPTVEANESRLVNKLYDKFDLNNADNGRMLPHQYKSALDVLTPKLNVEIAKSKNALRDLLLTKYPYKFKDEQGNIKDDDNTFQEVFFALYNDYVKALKEWTEEQNKKRAEIYDKAYDEEIKRLTEEDDEKGIKKLNVKKNDEYLRWFETEAYSRFTELNQTMANLLSVFSENDMKIIEGILDSGSGAELQEARETLRNLRKLTPDGAYVYPVKLNPTGWFKYLDSSFTYVDLLEDPHMLQAKLGELARSKVATVARYELIAKAIPDDKTLDAASNAVTTARKACSDAFTAMTTAGEESFGTFVAETTKMVIGIYTDPTLVGNSKEDVAKKVEAKKPEMDKKATDLVEQTLPKAVEAEVEENKEGEVAQKFDAKKKEKNSKISTVGDLITGFVDSITKIGTTMTKSLGEMNLALASYMDALEKNEKLKLNKGLELAAADLKKEIALIDEEMKDVKSRLDVASNMIGKEEVNVAAPPEGYATILIDHSCKDVHEEDYTHTYVSHSSSSAGFLCFKKRKSKTTTDSYSRKLFVDKESSMQIGMNVAKVGIEREWFNPGVFLLSENMYNLTDTKYTKLLSCFPTAMLIGRDITIKQKVKNARMFNYVHNSVTEIQNSGSYVFYNKSSGSKDSTTYSYYDAEEEAWIIITKIGTPQVIGFYLQDLPEDKSKNYKVSNDPDNIRKFIEEYMNVIKKRMAENKKN
jgi:hypothetical protein